MWRWKVRTMLRARDRQEVLPPFKKNHYWYLITNKVINHTDSYFRNMYVMYVREFGVYVREIDPPPQHGTARPSAPQSELSTQSAQRVCRDLCIFKYVCITKQSLGSGRGERKKKKVTWEISSYFLRCNVSPQPTTPCMHGLQLQSIFGEVCIAWRICWLDRGPVFTALAQGSSGLGWWGPMWIFFFTGPKIHCIRMKCESKKKKNQNLLKNKTLHSSMISINRCFSSICSRVEENNKQCIRKCISIVRTRPHDWHVHVVFSNEQQVAVWHQRQFLSTWLVTTFPCAGYSSHLKCWMLMCYKDLHRIDSSEFNF